MTATSEAGRLCELVFQLCDGEVADLRRLVELQGGRWHQDHGGAFVDWPPDRERLGVGIPIGADPTTTWASVCMALFGVLWTRLEPCRELERLYLAEWARRSKQGWQPAGPQPQLEPQREPARPVETVRSEAL